MSSRPNESKLRRFCTIHGNKLRCNYCDYEIAKNITRFRDHLSKCKGEKPEAHVAEISKLVLKRPNIFVPFASSSSSTSSPPTDSTRRSNSWLVDHLKKTESNRLTKLYAKMFFANALPFSLTEADEWKRLFNALRPAFQLPTRKQLATDLLEEEYSEISRTCLMKIAKAEYCTIVVDGWSNVRQDGIVNVIICTPFPIFHSSHSVGGERKDAQNLLNLVDPIMQEVGVNKIVGIVSDHESTMESLKKLVSQRYQHIAPIGCMAHVLNLFAKDIFKTPGVNETLNIVIAIVSEIRKSTVKTGKFEEIRTYLEQNGEPKALRLKMYCPTRFFSLNEMLRTVLLAKRTLQMLSFEPDIKLSCEFVTNIRRNDFWTAIEKLQQIFHPIAKAIGVAESDETTIGDIPEIWKKMEESINKVCPLEILRDSDNDQISLALYERYSMPMKNEFILLANLLHPNYRGSSLTDHQSIVAQNFLPVYCAALGYQSEEVRKATESLRDYLTSSNYFSCHTLKEKFRCPSQFWYIVKSFSTDSVLAEVAIRLFHIPSSNCSVERSFSIQSLIHTKKRNRLLNIRIEKLLYIKYNLRFLRAKKELKERMNLDESSLEDDEELSFESETDSIPEHENSLSSRLLGPTRDDVIDISDEDICSAVNDIRI